MGQITLLPPLPVPGTLHVLSHLIIKPSLRGRHCPHFTVEKTEAPRSCHHQRLYKAGARTTTETQVSVSKTQSFLLCYTPNSNVNKQGNSILIN